MQDQPGASHQTTRESRVGQPSKRSEIPSFMVMDVMSAAAKAEAEGRHIIHMEVGQPGTPAPESARAALAANLNNEKLGYTLALGMPELRQRIAQLYGEWYDVDLSANRIVVTNGSSAAFILAFLTLFEAGDTVALPSPGYPCYRHILSALGQKSRLLETGPATRWMPTLEQLEQCSGEIAGALIASPNNPTGTMLEPERLSAIAQFCNEQDIWFISDEIYHGLTFGQPAETALRYSDNAVIINSFSKYFSMTGWRVGWMVVPEALVANAERLAQNLFICAPAPSQLAALAAFEGTDELDRNRAVYAANRELLLSELPRVGFPEIVPADGAFYIYADVSAHTNNSLEFTVQMLAETGIAATSGVDFDEARGNRFVRFSYSGRTADVKDAITRLEAWQRLKT
ncbi:MAG: aminotransferase class I/II-fold pyridoxal phosphate-dependent enzyme [Hyphomicrobiaceae bacterium TMED74]|nr:1-aminocyclopropane-1-carboxylate deaminase [Filomicrobium sp.]RPG35807.1 MAG: aminotransferase class I/II-fold pyridoxal phosphate-dependent enzyme [Hyphomicrobiaceae bacterium TMED74]